MSSLYVFYKKIIVGKLTKNDDPTLSFRYSKTWLELEEAFPLSPALDIQEKTFNNREALAFFENLIPEGEVKDRLEKLTGKSLDSSYQFLELFGIDCAGAFTISKEKEVSAPADGYELEKINIRNLSLAHNDNQNLMAHVIQSYNGKFSLAGAQDKIPVTIKNSEIYIPTKGAPTSHILKPLYKTYSNLRK